MNLARVYMWSHIYIYVYMRSHAKGRERFQRRSVILSKLEKKFGNVFLKIVLSDLLYNLCWAQICALIGPNYMNQIWKNIQFFLSTNS